MTRTRNQPTLTADIQVSDLASTLQWLAKSLRGGDEADLRVIYAPATGEWEVQGGEYEPDPDDELTERFTLTADDRLREAACDLAHQLLADLCRQL